MVKLPEGQQYYRPSAPLELKIQMLRAEVLETMLCGCVTWSSRACHYDTLRRAYHNSWLAASSVGERTIAPTPPFYIWRIRDCRSAWCSENWWGARAAWGIRKNSGWGVSWTTSELLASTPTIERLQQPRTRGDDAGRRNKGRNVSWRDGSLLL